MIIILLFSRGTVFEGNTIGIAFTATICETPRSAVGLVHDGGGELDQLISTTAHELGHIFAMDHDDGEKCTLIYKMHIYPLLCHVSQRTLHVQTCINMENCVANVIPYWLVIEAKKKHNMFQLPHGVSVCVLVILMV